MSVKEIEVKQEDISNGKPGKTMHCPISLAANRAFGIDFGCEFADVYGNWTLRHCEERYEVKGGGRFACDFDSHREVVPRKFKIVRLEDAVDDLD